MYLYELTKTIKMDKIHSPNGLKLCSAALKFTAVSKTKTAGTTDRHSDQTHVPRMTSASHVNPQAMI
jgi:hypothetical protein